MKKKKEEAGGSAEAGIRALTVALFIILLAFFIVLNSMGVEDEKASLAALGSLTGSFGILPGGLSPSKEGEVKVLSSFNIPMEDRDVETVEIREQGKSEQGVVDVQDTPYGQTVRIRDRVLFDEGSYKIRTAAYGFLKNLCNIINQDDYPVEITGHTDDLPWDDKYTYSNQELSSFRALEVFKFFVVVGKVLPSRLVAFGCADNKPIASNETRQTRVRNRRVDIVLAKKASKGLKGIYQEDPSTFVTFKRFVFRIFD